MLNMSSGIIGNRNGTPDSTLRPPSARTIGPGHQLRASADMAAFQSSPQLSRARPSSDFFGQSNNHPAPPGSEDTTETLAQQWIDDINQNEQTLEEMAAATLDQDFKDELSAIEQWFRVLSEAERTAALYALLQQATPVQIRFFVQLLQQMGKSHPMAGVLSPANFEKDPMASRMTDAMGKLSVDGSRPSMPRSNVPAVKRLSGLDPSTINAMFPDAAAAIASEKAKFTSTTGAAPQSNRNSAILDNRTSLMAPTIMTSAEPDANSQPPSSPWGTRPAGRPKSSSGLPPMGQFQQPPLSAGLRSPRSNIPSALNLQNSNRAGMDGQQIDMPLLSPYAAGGNWASMVNTPMTANFGDGGNQANMIANATAMKLAALSTVNNRFALDDVRKFRRARSTDPSGNLMQGGPMSPAVPNSVVMINEHGQVMSRDQVMALQSQQQQMAMFNQRSRPASPGIALHGSGLSQMTSFTTPQNNGFLTAYEAPSLLNTGMGAIGGLSMGNFGMGHDFISDGSGMDRGRSPRGRRGSSKPPEDPTDPSLLQDIPSWLRSLRLHKYTENLKDMNWTELVELDEAALEARGVAAVGARRKMLKVFEQVKEAKAEGKLS